MSAELTPSPVSWHDQTRLLGVQVHAFFFDPGEVDARVSFVERYLPVFTRARPRRLGDEDDRLQYVAGDLSAQPDAVLEHGNGLICLTYRHTDRLLIEMDRWASQLRADLMLQAIAGAMAVAGARQQPAVAMLRIGNALFQFAPSPPVLECLATHIAAARRYWNAPKAVNASQLATFCEPKLRSLPGIALSTSPTSWGGVAAGNWT
jgi:hypothetical protein